MRWYADRQLASSDTELHTDLDFSIGFLDQITTGDSQVDRTLGAKRWDIVGSQERNFDGHTANAREQRSVLPTETEASLQKQFGRQFAESTLAGDADSKMIYYNTHEALS